MSKAIKVQSLFSEQTDLDALAPAAAEESNVANATNAVRVLLEFIGEDPNRSGLLDTPKRVVQAYSEMFSGYQEDPIMHLQRTFEDAERYNSPVMVTGINFQSTCEHHLLPFMGVAHLAYIPQGRVVGLSKLCRVVHGYSKRLQMQERLTQQIAEALCTGLNCADIAVVIEAYHLCMVMRGVKSEQSKTTTMILRGAFDENNALADRFFKTISRTTTVQNVSYK